MKIAIDLRPVVTGIRRGIYFYTRGLWEALRRFDHENQYLGLERYPLQEWRNKSKLTTISWDSFFLPIYLRRQGVDLLHLTSPNEADFNFNRGGRLRGYKTVVTIHDIIPFLFPKQLLEPLDSNTRRTFEAQVRQSLQADHLIAISQATKKDLIEHFSLPAEKISVVYQCNHDDRFRPRKKEEAPESEFIFNPSGSGFHKNFDNVLAAYAQLPKGLRARYRLVSQAWLPPEELQRREDLAHKLGVGPRVRFLKEVKEQDIPLLYNAAALTLVPSHYEGFGLNPLESMASGTPVIAGNTSSQPEVCGEAAILVDPEDVGEITQAMVRLLEDKELYRSLRRKGLAQAKKFSQERRASETVGVYGEVVKDAS